MTAPMIFREPWPPLWFVMLVPPQGELAATDWLRAQGIAEAWHPTETVYIRHHFHRNKRIPRQKPIATGYLFVRLPRRPIWPFLFEQSRGRISDVMRIGERPVALADSDLMQMREVPERLRGIREAAAEAARIRPGDTVTILEGGMAGWQVTVEAVTDGLVRFTAPGGWPVKVEEAKVGKP